MIFFLGGGLVPQCCGRRCTIVPKTDGYGGMGNSQHSSLETAHETLLSKVGRP
jgi:hypothetical protein